MFFDKAEKNVTKIKGAEVVGVHPNGRYFTVYNTVVLGSEYELSPILNEIGFKIIEARGSLIAVTMPEGWYHIQIDKKTDELIDCYGRKRAIIDKDKKTTKFLTRYKINSNYVLRDLPDGSIRILELKIMITDSDQIITMSEYEPEDIAVVMELQFNNNVDSYIKSIETGVYDVLEKEYPGWQDPLLYWSVT